LCGYIYAIKLTALQSPREEKALVLVSLRKDYQAITMSNKTLRHTIDGAGDKEIKTHPPWVSGSLPTLQTSRR
jgi:hypothetical protein